MTPALLLGTILLSTQVMAADITVLSGGAIEPGLRAVAAAFENQSAHRLDITFNTAPQIQKRIESNDKFDVVIAPPATIEPLVKTRTLQPGGTDVGRVSVGVVVRDGAQVPDIGNTDALKRAMLDADAIVFNRASTGVYFESLLRRLDLWSAVEPKITRYPDGAAVIDHVRNGKGREIGIAAITEILLYKDKGARFVGPLPADVQNATSYVATTMPSASAAAREFIAFLGTPEAKALLRAAGID